MQDKIAAVAKFHDAFGLGMRNTPKADLGEAKNLLRYKLMREENEEFLQQQENEEKFQLFTNYQKIVFLR